MPLAEGTQSGRFIKCSNSCAAIKTRCNPWSSKTQPKLLKCQHCLYYKLYCCIQISYDDFIILYGQSAATISLFEEKTFAFGLVEAAWNFWLVAIRAPPAINYRCIPLQDQVYCDADIGYRCIPLILITALQEEPGLCRGRCSQGLFWKHMVIDVIESLTFFIYWIISEENWHKTNLKLQSFPTSSAFQATNTMQEYLVPDVSGCIRNPFLHSKSTVKSKAMESLPLASLASPRLTWVFPWQMQSKQQQQKKQQHNCVLIVWLL